MRVFLLLGLGLAGCGGGTFTADNRAAAGTAGTAGAGDGGSSSSAGAGAGGLAGGTEAGAGGSGGSTGGGAGKDASGGTAGELAGAGGVAGGAGLGGVAGELALGGTAGDAPLAGSGGGGGAPMACGKSAGDEPYKFLDDLEDGDRVLGNDASPQARAGLWFTGTSCDGAPGALTPSENPDNGSDFAAMLSGEGCGRAWIGVDFNNCNGVRARYDVSAYAGVSFRYRSNEPIRVMVTTVGNLPTTEGGSCSGVDCYNHHGKNFAGASSWTAGQVTWAELRGDAPIGTPPSPPQTFGETRPFATGTVLTVEFQVETDGAVELWVDDLRFL